MKTTSIWEYPEAQSIGDHDQYALWLKRHPSVRRNKIKMVLVTLAVLLAPAAIIAPFSWRGAIVAASILLGFFIPISAMVWTSGTGVSLGGDEF